jgi:hypothetical protein
VRRTDEKDCYTKSGSIVRIQPRQTINGLAENLSRLKPAAPHRSPLERAFVLSREIDLPARLSRIACNHNQQSPGFRITGS